MARTLYIFYDIQKYTFVRSFTKHFEIIVTAKQLFGKIWVLQCQNGAMTHISWKTKSCRQNALFLWPVKLMLLISNLLLHLIEISRFQKHIDGLLTDMYIPRQSHVKNYLRIHSLNIPFLYPILSYQTYTYLKKSSWKSIDLFKKIV